MSNETLNIQPKASILATFSRLNYKPQYAIGEFVDNSTASFFGHEKSLHEIGVNNVTIRIEYDIYENVLTIIDDAYGMDRSDFIRAILLDQKPDHLNGRNEFGMGLKTAASWFGKFWSVRSSRLGSDVEYYAEIDIERIKEKDLNNVEIITTKVEPTSHYTIIKISKITRKIKQTKIIKDLLSGIYRRDIISGKVDIYFNNEKLYFEPFKVLKFRNTEWKKDITFSLNYENRIYSISGFVGIMEKGSFSKAGFTLFRYNRAIVGGFDKNYKPQNIFGQAQSQVSLKLFGELNMEDFPVNQAKDGFAWDDGLEEEFVVKLKEEIKDYINIAELSKKARVEENEINSDISERVKEDVQKSFNDTLLNDDSIVNDDRIEVNSDICLFEQQQNENNQIISKVSSDRREYNVKLDNFMTEKITVSWEISTVDNWITYDSPNREVVININHPFFKPFNQQLEFKIILEKFVIAFVCAEELAKKASRKDGYMLPDIFRNKMNGILKKIEEIK